VGGVRRDDPLTLSLRRPQAVSRGKDRQESENSRGKPALSRHIGPRAESSGAWCARQGQFAFRSLAHPQLPSLIWEPRKLRALIQSSVPRFPPGRQPNFEVSGTLPRFFVWACTGVDHAAEPDLVVASLFGGCGQDPLSVSNRKAPGTPRETCSCWFCDPVSANGQIEGSRLSRVVCAAGPTGKTCGEVEVPAHPQCGSLGLASTDSCVLGWTRRSTSALLLWGVEAFVEAAHRRAGSQSRSGSSEICQAAIIPRQTEADLCVQNH
jgi:hypothetical protein